MLYSLLVFSILYHFPLNHHSFSWFTSGHCSWWSVERNKLAKDYLIRLFINIKTCSYTITGLLFHDSLALFLIHLIVFSLYHWKFWDPQYPRFQITYQKMFILFCKFIWIHCHFLKAKKTMPFTLDANFKLSFWRNLKNYWLLVFTLLFLHTLLSFENRAACKLQA